jgi:hypothetical protein
MKVCKTRAVLVLALVTVVGLANFVKALDTNDNNLNGDELERKGEHGLSSINEADFSQREGEANKSTRWCPKVRQLLFAMHCPLQH